MTKILDRYDLKIAPVLYYNIYVIKERESDKKC